MEFKQPKKKGAVSFSKVDTESVKPAQKKSLKWFEEDEEWLDLINTVEQDTKNKKDKTKRRKILKKKESAFDKPNEKKPKIQKTTILKPHVKKVKLYVKNHKSVVVFGVLVLVVGIFGLNKTVFKEDDKDIAGASITAPQSSADLPREKPSFKILYPGNKDENSVGELVKVSPPASAPVYTYLDNVGEIQLNVSQQELPDTFKINQDGELQKLAGSFQANDVIQVDSVKVYHGQSGSGVQSLLFIKGNLLITIRSSQKITNDTWAAYISALHS